MIWGLVGDKVQVPANVEKMVAASMRVTMLLLRKSTPYCADGWSVLQLMWHHRDETVKRRRMSGFPGGDSSFLKLNLTERADSMMVEILDSATIVAQRIQSVLAAQPLVAVRVLEAWLRSDAESAIHDVVRATLMLAPRMETDRLGLLLGLEIDDLRRATALLRERQASCRYTAWALWQWLSSAIDLMMLEEIRWEAAMRNSGLLNQLETDRAVVRDLWAVSGAVDNLEVQDDDIKCQQAKGINISVTQAINAAQWNNGGGGGGGGRKNGNGRGNGRGGGGGGGAGPINRFDYNGGGGGGGGAGNGGAGKKRNGAEGRAPKDKAKGNKRDDAGGQGKGKKDSASLVRRVLDARKARNTVIESKGTEDQLKAASSLCALFSVAQDCPDFKAAKESDRDYCESGTWRGLSVPGKKFGHKCLCGGKHPLINCRKWHSK